MFEAFANAGPLHRVKRIDALPPWIADLKRHRFLCVMCDVLITGADLVDSDCHVYVTAPCPGWERVSCLVCGEWTVPTVENAKKCDYCNGLQWWKPRSQK